MNDLIEYLDVLRSSLDSLVLPLRPPHRSDSSLISSLGRAHDDLEVVSPDGSRLPWYSQPWEAVSVRLGATFEYFAFADDLTAAVTSPTLRFTVAIGQLVLSHISD